MEFFSILSGIALVVLALFPGGGISVGRRAGIVALGVLFAGYGLFVMTRTSGTWSFPVVIFVLPFLIGFVLVGDILETRRKAAAAREAGRAPGAAPTSAAGLAPASLPPAARTSWERPVPASLPVAGRATSSACSACGAELRPEVRWCTRCGVQRTAPAAVGTATATVPAWLSRRNLLIGGGAVAAVVVVAVVAGSLRDGGPSADDQAMVRESLLAAANESLCLDAASEGRYFASEMSTVITEDVWAESSAYASVVEPPFVRLATQCGYEYGLTALNEAGIVGLTYQALDGAMFAAAPAVAAPLPEPEPEPAPDPEPEPAPSDVDLSGLPSEVTLAGGGTFGGFGMFPPEADVIAYLTDRLGPPSEVYPVACDSATVGRQYRWGELLVFVDDQDLSFEHPADGPVTIQAPFVSGWHLTGEDGERTWLRTSEGLGIDDGVDLLQELYPNAYSLDPGDGGPVAWEYFAGDLTNFLFFTTGTAPDDWVLSIRSGSTCDV